MRKKLLLCLVLLTVTVCSAQTASVAGEWRGIWTSPSGFVFTADLTLSTGPGCNTCAAAGDGSIQGQIVWTLRKVAANASPDYAAKVGLTGTEFVKGEMKGDGFLVFNGYRKDDPSNIIGLDRYRLALSDDGKVIGGITYDNGPWTGQFVAVRAQP
jgi:hypothetical protein